MTVAYLYKWTHIPSGRWYIGSRSKKNCHPEDGYICSSKIVKPMILLAPHEWSREILATGDPFVIRGLEKMYLVFYDAKNNPNSFNLHNNSGNYKKDRTGYKDSAATRLKKSQSKKGKKRPEHSLKLTGKKRPEFGQKMKGTRKGDSNPNSKLYKVIEPNNKQYLIKGLKSFCEDLNKPVATAREMAMGKYANNTCTKGQWAGWTIIKMDVKI